MIDGLRDGDSSQQSDGDSMIESVLNVPNNYQSIDEILSGLTQLKVLSSYSKALRNDFLLVEAHCIAQDIEQIATNHESLHCNIRKSGHSGQGGATDDRANFESIHIWNDWRKSLRNGDAMEQATERVMADPEFPSSVVDWLALKSDKSMCDMVKRRGSTPPIPTNMPSDGWSMSDSPTLSRLPPDHEYPLPLNNTYSNPVVVGGTVDRAQDERTIQAVSKSPGVLSERGAQIKAHLDARFEEAKLKREKKIRAELDQELVDSYQQRPREEPGDMILCDPTAFHHISTSQPINNHHVEDNSAHATTPVPVRSSYTPLISANNRSTGKMRMHRSLKFLNKKRYQDGSWLSDDEENDFKDFGERPPSNVSKKAKWAENKKAWEAEVKKQQCIDPYSIFGWGSAKPVFSEVFKTPDFKRAAQELARKHDPKCRTVLTKEGRDAIERKWHDDKGPTNGGVSVKQVQEYRKRVEHKVSAAHLVWDESWTACEDGCSHNSALRQPWFRETSKTNTNHSYNHNSNGGNPSTIGRRSTMVVNNNQSPSHNHYSNHNNNLYENTVIPGVEHELIGQDKASWLTKVFSGFPGTLEKNSKSDYNWRRDASSTPRVTGGLLKGLHGSFAMPALKENPI